MLGIQHSLIKALHSTLKTLHVRCIQTSWCIITTSVWNVSEKLEQTKYCELRWKERRTAKAIYSCQHIGSNCRNLRWQKTHRIYFFKMMSRPSTHYSQMIVSYGIIYLRISKYRSSDWILVHIYLKLCDSGASWPDQAVLLTQTTKRKVS